MKKQLQVKTGLGRLALINLAAIFVFVSCFSTKVKTTIVDTPEASAVSIGAISEIETPEVMEFSIGAVSATWIIINSSRDIDEKSIKQKLRLEAGIYYPGRTIDLRNITTEKIKYEDHKHIIGPFYRHRDVYQITANGEVWEIRR
jgi:hypothetical protein